VESPETGYAYAVDRLLGEGGFGQVYLARRRGRSRDVPEVLCIKVSTRIDGWLREAYFGQLLDITLLNDTQFWRLAARRRDT
jgi:serine/threonine protein kinase